MTHKVHRAASLLRTEMFATMDREITNKIVLAYTDHVPDPRIDAQFIDYTDGSKGYFGCSHHYVIGTEGRIEIGRDPRTRSSRTRMKRMHREAIHIGVVGGLSADTGYRVDTINDAQNAAVDWLTQQLADTLGTSLEITDHIETWAASRDLHSKEAGKSIRANTIDHLYALMTDEELAASDDRITT
jgi:hypothetical protein